MIDFERISKQEARKRYNSGEKIYMTASKVNPGNLVEVEIDNHAGSTFESWVAEFTSCYCCKEAGLRPAFYLKQEW